MHITETSPTADLKYGNVEVGTAAVPLAEFNPQVRAQRGIALYANPNNTAPIWIGGPTVQTSGAGAGFGPMPPGMSVVVPVDRPDQLFCISTDGGQHVSFMAV